MADIGKLELRAEAARQKRADALANIEKDRTKTELGKREERVKVEAVYNAAIAALRAEGERELAIERGNVETALKAARLAATRKRRETLGTEIELQLLRDELRYADSHTIVKRAESAVDEWERLAVIALGKTELERRARDESQPTAVLVQKLLDMAADPRVAEHEKGLAGIEVDEKRVARLDTLESEADLVRRFGLSDGLVERRTPVPEDYGQYDRTGDFADDMKPKGPFIGPVVASR